MIKIIIYFVAFCFACASTAQEINRLTMQQAKSLVSTVMWRSTKSNPCVIFDPKESDISDEKIKSTRFVDFMITCRVGQGVAYYSVDFYTGDVFDPILECFEIKNKKLKILQKQIRQSLHLTEAEYKKIKTKGPMCDE